MRILVLPGMDGGAELSTRFRAELAPDDVVGVEYGTDEPVGYDTLLLYVRSLVDASAEPVVVVAESFSGPIAIRLAAAAPRQLRGVALVATFASPVAWPGWRHLARPSLFSVPPPAFAVRRSMLDATASDEEVRQVLAAIARPEPRVMSRRLREVLTVDVRADLERCRLPMAALRATRDRLLDRRRFVRVPNTQDIEAPHLVLFARPERAAEAVRAFVDNVRS